MCLKRALEKQGGINHQDVGSAPGSFRTDCPQRGCAGQWAGFRRPLHGDPRVSPPLHRAFFSRKRREREAAPSGPRKRNQPGPEFRETGLWRSPRRPGSRLRPAAPAPRAPRAPGRPPDSPRPSRGRPVGAGRGSRKARRLLGRSAPDTKSATGDPGEEPGRAPGAPPAGRPGTDASGGERRAPPKSGGLLLAGPAPRPPRGPVRLSGAESGAPRSCDRDLAAAPRLRRPGSLDLFAAGSGRRPLASSWSPPPCPPLPHLTEISQ